MKRLKIIQDIGKLFGKSAEATQWYERTKLEYLQLTQWVEQVKESAFFLPKAEININDPILRAFLEDAGAEVDVLGDRNPERPMFRLVNTEGGPWYTLDKRTNQSGYSDYDSAGVIYPQWVLEDLVRLFYTDAPTEELYFIKPYQDSGNEQ
ncbi:MAG: hypothetical protein PF495_04875 [Spirochaetales bacterium]|nr:hypothetical protein [Spirochaetales bacterium]